MKFMKSIEKWELDFMFAERDFNRKDEQISIAAW